jgi:hypothetical protein
MVGDGSGGDGAWLGCYQRVIAPALFDLVLLMLSATSSLARRPVSCNYPIEASTLASS